MKLEGIKLGKLDSFDFFMRTIPEFHFHLESYEFTGGLSAPVSTDAKLATKKYPIHLLVVGLELRGVVVQASHQIKVVGGLACEGILTAVQGQHRFEREIVLLLQLILVLKTFDDQGVKPRTRV